jgi:hypothetical protein
MKKALLLVAILGSMVAVTTANAETSGEVKIPSLNKAYAAERVMKISPGRALLYGTWLRSQSDGIVTLSGKALYRGDTALGKIFSRGGPGWELMDCRVSGDRFICDVRYVYAGEAPKRLNFGYPDISKSAAAAGTQVPAGPWADEPWKIGDTVIHNLFGTVEVLIPKRSLKEYPKGYEAFAEQACAAERNGRTSCNLISISPDA